MQVFPLVMPRVLRWSGVAALALVGLGVALLVFAAIAFGFVSAIALLLDGGVAVGGAILLAFVLALLGLDRLTVAGRHRVVPRYVPVPRVCVGADGVAVHGWTGRVRFHPWSRIRGARCAGAQVTLELEGSAEERVRVADPQALVALVGERAGVRAPAPRAPRVRLFEPEGELDARWLERVRRVDAEGGYRQEHVGEPALLELVDDAAQPAAQRIGAALALSRGSDAARRRARIAIEETADPALARVLEEALAGELEARSLRRLPRR